MFNIVNICGWLGALCFSIYTIPQAVDAFQKKKTENMSSGMVWLLFFGPLCSLIYILPDFTSPLFYNFSISLVTISIILRYHFFPKNKKKSNR